MLTVCFNTTPNFGNPMKNGILSAGEKVHIIHRRYLEKEPHRHFIGTVGVYEGEIARVTGHLFTVDPIRFEFFRRPERRTRLVSLLSGDLLVNIIPSIIDLDGTTCQRRRRHFG
jgi:hypothetical protein